MTIARKSDEEIEQIAAAGCVLVETLECLALEVRPGAVPADLDRIAEDFIRSRGAVPSCKGYRGYPASICVSPNALAVHGIPGPRALEEGDIVTLDLAVTKDGWVADAARTYAVGEVDNGARRLIDTAEAALRAGAEQCRAGHRLGDISEAIQRTTEGAGFSVLRALRGHGVGRELHEEPLIANFGEAGTGVLLEPGMVLAIEPMIGTGGTGTYIARDGWGVFSEDGSLTAHSEWTVAVGSEGGRILTPW